MFWLSLIMRSAVSWADSVVHPLLRPGRPRPRRRCPDAEPLPRSGRPRPRSGTPGPVSPECPTKPDEVMRLAAARVRALEEAPKTPVLLIEDHAPGHTGDKDGFLQNGGSEIAVGWQEKRKEQLRSLCVHRCIIPRHATPFLCANDQIHAQLYRDIKKELANQIGLSAGLTKRVRFETKS